MGRFRVDRKESFVSVFDEKTGFYARSGIISNGIESCAEPFMSSFPELLDVGIMGHCVHGKTGLCAKSGVQCYQSGSVVQQPNMTIEDFEEILRQCHHDTFQIALGGRGDPDMHESFENILKLCRQYHIVPNFTTSGYGMTPEKTALCKEYCGAVAVSWYRSSYTLAAIQMLLDAGVKTNIHYVLGKNSIDEAIERLEFMSFPAGINAVVFLLHKPIGLGTEANMLTTGDPRVQKFFSLVDGHDFPFKIGFDSCTIPGILNFTSSIDRNTLDTCEGARWSAYISPDMKMLPCSFDNEAMRWAVDLRTHTIQEAWDSEQFENFRQHFRNACHGCPNWISCLGGCPIVPQVVLCERK